MITFRRRDLLMLMRLNAPWFLFVSVTLPIRMEVVMVKANSNNVKPENALPEKTHPVVSLRKWLLKLEKAKYPDLGADLL